LLDPFWIGFGFCALVIFAVSVILQRSAAPRSAPSVTGFLWDFVFPFALAGASPVLARWIETTYGFDHWKSLAVASMAAGVCLFAARLVRRRLETREQMWQ